MIRITALNDQNKYASGGQKPCIQISTTKEALESESIALYNKGLSFRNEGQTKEAIEALREVLNSPFLQETTFTNLEDGISHSAELLKYSVYKNLAEMSKKEDNLVVAMEYYIEAVTVDGTDVTVWFKMGLLAMTLENFSLARHAFETGLQCNHYHWPCLDNVISLLYALNNYEACLHYIAKALERDPNYGKGIVFQRKIFSEHPGLRSWSHDMFLKCDQSIYVVEVDEEESAEYIDDAVAVRRRKQELSKSQDIPFVAFTQPLVSLKWKNLGECLLSLYEYVSQTVKGQLDVYDGSKCRVSMTSCVDLSANILPPAYQDTTSIPSSSVQSQALDGSVAGTTVTDSIPSTPTHDPPVLLSEVGPEMEIEQCQYSGGRKRGRKRRNMFVDEPECKRRSARVKNPVKGSIEEPISFHKMLTKFLPKSLLTVVDDRQVAAADLRSSDGASGGDDRSKDQSDKTCPLKCLENEEEDVQKFISNYKENNGIIDLISRYLLHLAGHSDFIWPDGLIHVFVKLYHKLRKHIVFPNYFANDCSDEQIQKMAKMSLLHKELKLDRCLINRINLIQPSPKKSPIVGMMGSSNFPGKYFESDVDYLVGLTAFSDKLGDFWLEFCIRVFWLQARYSLLLNDMEMATNYFEKTTEFVQMLSEGTSICLSNCSSDRIISLRELERQLDSLRRCQSMEELRRLVDSGQHMKVIDFLLPTYAAAKDLDVERMKLLQESIIASNEFRRGLLWAEEYFHETLQRFKNTTSESNKDICKDVMIQLLVALNQFLEGDQRIMLLLPGHWMFRLSHDLLDIISISLDVPDGSSEMALETVMPWIILYKLIKHFEETNDSGAEDDVLLPSLSLLVYAHEYLGRHSWCMTCDGELLLFIVEALTDELDKYDGDDLHPFEEDLDNALQQCFCCLYGHRSKKAKYLDDHNAPQIPLTLERCQRVFDFFKPKTLPEYDSYKMNAISAELEVLLRRISALLPPINAGIEAEISAYIDGATNTLPSLPVEKECKHPLVKELSYLLADYYFKNKEQLKAVKFYMYDICINPMRFDSWAGMALARSSRLENKLTSHDSKHEASLQKQAFSTLRCFKRAMELDDSNVKLWIEYGSCAYQLHSHASRLIKQTKFSPLSKETMDQAVSNKAEMLTIAMDCYNQAEACAVDSGNKEEKWFLHYMLGKIAEKLDQDPRIYLEHYKKASNCLHEDKAKYPKKISYFSPPHLSVEVLEMYYRLHVSIVKYLLKVEADLERIPFDVFESYVKDASSGPLINFVERKHDRTSEVAENKENREAVGGKSGAQTSCSDHNYFKQKAASTPGCATYMDNFSPTDNTSPPNNLPTSTFPISTVAVFPLEPPPQVDVEASVQNRDNTFATAVNEQPLDLTIHPLETTVDAAAVPSLPPSGQSTWADSAVENGTQTHTEKEVSCFQSDTDLNRVNCKNLPETAAAFSQTISSEVEIPGSEKKTAETSHECKSDSDALEELISTLAAVQKTIEKEAEITFKQENNDDNDDDDDDEVLLLSPVFAGIEIKMQENEVQAQPEAALVEMEMSENLSDLKPEISTSVLDHNESSKGGAPPEDVSGLAQQETDSKQMEKQEKEEDVLLSVPVSSGLSKDLVNSEVKESLPSQEQLLKRFLALMNDCMKALNLCQARFPEHFRSVYRLAYIRFYSAHYKDIGRCKELLLGGTSFHFGVFHERKQNNFFNGLWRNPIQDLDRWGSFSAHLNRALLLLFEVLVATRDSRMLFNLHQHLCRAPVDIGKKYLRDTDRIQLAHMAFLLCCKAIEAQIRDYESSKTSATWPDNKFLLHVCMVRQQAYKLNLNVKLLDELVVAAYNICRTSLDAYQTQFFQLQIPKLTLLGLFERDVRYSGQPPMPTSATSSKCSFRPTLPSSASMSLEAGKPFQAPCLPIQRIPLLQDKTPKPSVLGLSSDDVEIIDLSNYDSASVINLSSSADDDMLTEEANAANILPDVSDGLKGRSEEPKDKLLAICGSKDFEKTAHVQALKFISKPVPTSSKFMSRPAQFQTVSPRAPPVTFVSKTGPSDTFLKAADSAKVVQPAVGSAKFLSLSKQFMNKPINAASEHLHCFRAEPSTKVSLPRSLLSDIDLLSTLPQATRDILACPLKKMERTLVKNQTASVASKSCSSQQSQGIFTATRVLPSSSSPPSEPSSSSLSENEEDEVIELSSAVESE